MLPENLIQFATAVSLDAALPAVVTAGKLDCGQLTLEVSPESIVAVCGLLKSELEFERLASVTAVDRYPAEPRFEVVYELHSVSKNERLRLKARLGGGDPEIDSVTSVWRAANWYERETFDLFGVRFRHHPNLCRIMLPADWEGYPLRKDYPITGPRQ